MFSLKLRDSTLFGYVLHFNFTVNISGLPLIERCWEKNEGLFAVWEEICDSEKTINKAYLIFFDFLFSFLVACKSHSVSGSFCVKLGWQLNKLHLLQRN